MNSLFINLLLDFGLQKTVLFILVVAWSIIISGAELENIHGTPSASFQNESKPGSKLLLFFSATLFQLSIYEFIGWLLPAILIISISYIRGIAAMEFYQKVVRWLYTDKTRNRRSSVKPTLFNILLVCLTLISLINVAIITHLTGDADLNTTIIQIWTLFTIATAIIGLNWKLKSISENINKQLFYGLILVFGFANVYNFPSLLHDVGVLVFSKIAFIIGYLNAVASLYPDSKLANAFKTLTILYEAAT